MGGASIDVHGVPLTDDTVAEAKNCDAVLMGSIGGDAKTSPWYQLEPSKRPEAGLLRIRKELNLFANLRPAVLYDELKGACPLKEEITAGGFDMMSFWTRSTPTFSLSHCAFFPANSSRSSEQIFFKGYREIQKLRTGCLCQMQFLPGFFQGIAENPGIFY